RRSEVRDSRRGSNRAVCTSVILVIASRLPAPSAKRHVPFFRSKKVGGKAFRQRCAASATGGSFLSIAVRARARSIFFRGDVGIIRSPVRASILPDYIGVNRVAGDPASRSADFRSTRES